MQPRYYPTIAKPEKFAVKLQAVAHAFCHEIRSKATPIDSSFAARLSITVRTHKTLAAAVAAHLSGSLPGLWSPGSVSG
jgi:hypothetical protein